MPLGRFLEISLAATDVAASLAFYESLGFVQASVGEAWPHPYAVVTDGRLSLGLHGAEFDESAADLGRALAARTSRCARRPRRDHRRRASRRCFDASGAVARSLGPAVAAARGAHVLATRAVAGAFERPWAISRNSRIATLDLAAASAFWERLGFVAFEPVREPFAKSRRRQPRSQCRALRDRPAGAGAGVHRRCDAGTNRKPARPGPSLRAAHCRANCMAIGAAMLEAPEGTQLLLLKELAAG